MLSTGSSLDRKSDLVSTGWSKQEVMNTSIVDIIYYCWYILHKCAMLFVYITSTVLDFFVQLFV